MINRASLLRPGTHFRLASAIAFTFLLASFPIDTALPIAPLITMLWLALLFPERRSFILGAGSLIEILIAARTTGTTHFQLVLADIPSTWYFLSGYGRHAPVGLPNLVARAIAFLLFALIAWFFLNRPSRKIRSWVTPISLLILLALTTFFEAVKDARPLLAYFTLVTVLLWAKFMWGLLLAVNMGLGFRPFPYRHMWSISPAWKFDVLPNWVPSRVDLPPADAPARRAEGPQFFFVTAALAAFAWAYRLTSPSFFQAFPTLAGTGSILFLERVPSVAAAWALLFSDFFFFFTYALGLVLSIAYLFLELVGIPAAPSVTNPQLSRSFHEFNTRILRFYIQMITEVAYAPFAAILSRFLSYGRLRVFVATFLSVLALGILYHFLGFVHLLALFGLRGSLGMFLADQLPYVLLFAFASATSVALAMKRRPAPLPRWKHGLRLGLIVAFNAVLLSLVFNALMDDGPGRLRVLRFLFTGIR